jgi:hypothetical protein
MNFTNPLERSTSMITPTIGRVILVHARAQGATGPWPCLVTKVWGDRCINAAGFNEWGTTVSYSSLRLLQDDDAAPEHGEYAEWMPYQKGQAAKTEALEQQVRDIGTTGERQ